MLATLADSARPQGGRHAISTFHFIIQPKRTMNFLDFTFFLDFNFSLETVTFETVTVLKQNYTVHQVICVVC